MKTTLGSLTFAAAVLSASLSATAFADEARTSPAAQPSAPLMLAASDTMDKAKGAADEAGDVISDSWITGKVKSSFLADDSISGLDIEVETTDGVVSLSGVVPSDAERDLAVEKAKSIKGVREVAADGLKSTE